MNVRVIFKKFFGYPFFFVDFFKIEIGLLFCQRSSLLIGYSLHGQIQPLGKR